MSAPLTYNRTTNKLLALFHSITNRKQIRMAERYANLLISKTVENCGGGFWEKETMERLLWEIVDNNMYLLTEDEKI